MVGGTAVGVDENDLAGVDSVHGNELPNEDFVRAVPVEDLEPERQRVAHLRGGLDVLAGSVRDLHRHVRRVHDHLLGHGSLDIALDAEVDLIGDGLVGEVILAGNGEPQIRAGDDGVVVLDDDIVEVPPEPLVFHIALHVVVGHLQLEVEALPHVLDAGVGAALGVDLPVEELRGLDPRHHVARSAVDRHVVARAQLVRRGLRHVQIRVLNVG